ncbi:hypothetical protein APHNP_1791 [Anaplasma phagocytophilum str. ApNP]|uniref:Uncharacterized protein n=2 Tax=Anaplasma phagocytophilum TaxID=948 RepID=A0A0F3NFF5_ANAPH|nr:hypothetical protein APHMUC_0212 [Anaplasma phagocytophilum str. ApMUC09]KJV66437.1 hypothetical protein APHNP_1791 [Anaplasma phagocytophilum str. ApNP]
MGLLCVMAYVLKVVAFVMQNRLPIRDEWWCWAYISLYTISLLWYLID